MEILETLLLVILIASSFVLTIAIILLPPKETSMGQAIGGSEDLNLFGKKKSRGAVAVLEKVTITSSAVFMISAFLYNVVVAYS